MSYTQVDRPWAEWIAWHLEEAGHQVLVQAWDMVPGGNWVDRIHQGVQHAARTIALLSPDYLRSVYGTAEWQAAWQQGKLVPVRVRECDRPGLLGPIGGIDLFDVSDEMVARDRLHETIKVVLTGSGRPDTRPGYPPDSRAIPERPCFPGASPHILSAGSAFGPILPREQAELVEFCSELPLNLIYDLYRRAVSPGLSVSPQEGELTDVAGAIARLTELMVSATGFPPLLKFAVWAAYKAANAGYAEITPLLNKWVDDVATRLELRKDSVDHLRRKVREEGEREPQSYYLVVRLDRHLARDDRYSISVFLYRDEKNSEPQPCGDDDRAYSLDELREQLGELLPKIVRTLDDDTKLTVEFLVPRELLNQDFDQWMIQPEPSRQYCCLCVLYTVVVRDLDRERHNATHARWHRKWNLLQAGGHAHNSSAVQWLDLTNNRGPEAFRATQWYRCVLRPLVHYPTPWTSRVR